jgi:hypothetical protein
VTVPSRGDDTTQPRVSTLDNALIKDVPCKYRDASILGAIREGTRPRAPREYGLATANGKLISASRELLRYFDGQNLPAAIIPTGRARGVATDSATALRTLGQLRGVPAVSGFSRPKPHLGRFSFWYTHWSILLS